RAAERRHARRGASPRPRRGGLGDLGFPCVEQAFDVTSLLVRERDVCEEAPHLGGIVVLDGGLESLAHRQRLCGLASQPAAQADLRRARHWGRRTRMASPSIATEPPSASTSRTATAAPRSRRSSPSRTGPEYAVTGRIVNAGPSAVHST